MIDTIFFGSGVQMLNFITKLDKTDTKIGNPDVYFDLKLDYYAKKCNSDSELKTLMLKIDGVDLIQEKYIRTKFGGTSLDNLSNGCKVAIIMKDDPELVINLSEIGSNVIRVLAEEPCTIYRVNADYVPLGLDKSNKEVYFVDGVRCKDASEACEKLCKVFRSLQNSKSKRV